MRGRKMRGLLTLITQNFPLKWHRIKIICWLALLLELHLPFKSLAASKKLHEKKVRITKQHHSIDFIYIFGGQNYEENYLQHHKHHGWRNGNDALIYTGLSSEKDLKILLKIYKTSNYSQNLILGRKEKKIMTIKNI